MVKKNSGKAIASFVLGLCSLFFSWTLIVPLLGIGFGFFGLADIKKNEELKGKGFAIIGIILSVIFLLISVWILHLWFIRI